ncbi:MAG: glycosyltransferase family 9 protein [Candidatus Aminicenantales bacterium]
MRSIIAVRRGGLGDLLTALPSLRLLRSALPEARITLVARRAYGRLIAAAGVVDAVEDADDFRWAALAAPEAAKSVACLSLPEADLVVGWFQASTAEDFQKNAAALWPAAEVRTFKIDPAAGLPLNISFFAQTAAFLSELNRPGVSFADCARLPLSVPLDFDTRPGRFANSPYIVVHPGGGSRAKLWPGEYFRGMIRWFAEAGFSGAVVLGEAEEDLRAEWTGWAGSERPAGWILLDRPPLEDLAALLSGASFYCGNDSGVTHLAAVLGTSGLAVFREKFARAWNPGGNITVVSSPEVRDISIDEVFSRLDFSRPNK